MAIQQDPYEPDRWWSRRSSMQVPLWCLRHLFGLSFEPDSLSGIMRGVGFGEVEAVHVQFQINTLQYRGAWR
jgi:hypothetical protein